MIFLLAVAVLSNVVGNEFGPDALEVLAQFLREVLRPLCGDFRHPAESITCEFCHPFATARRPIRVDLIEQQTHLSVSEFVERSTFRKKVDTFCE